MADTCPLPVASGTWTPTLRSISTQATPIVLAALTNLAPLWPLACLLRRLVHRAIRMR